MQEEFYATAFRKKVYHTLQELQQDVDNWLNYYNRQRPNSGRYCYGKTPYQTFVDSIHLAQAKQLNEQFTAAAPPANAPLEAAQAGAFAGGADDGNLRPLLENQVPKIQ